MLSSASRRSINPLHDEDSSATAIQLERNNVSFAVDNNDEDSPNVHDSSTRAFLG